MNFNEILLSLLPFTSYNGSENSVFFTSWAKLNNVEQFDSVFIVLLFALYLIYSISRLNQNIVILNKLTSLLNNEAFFTIGLFGMFISFYIAIFNINIYQETFIYSIASSISIFLWALWIVIINKLIATIVPIKINIT